jgi:hypothetical protein
MCEAHGRLLVTALAKHCATLNLRRMEKILNNADPHQGASGVTFL